MPIFGLADKCDRKIGESHQSDWPAGKDPDHVTIPNPQMYVWGWNTASFEFKDSYPPINFFTWDYKNHKYIDCYRRACHSGYSYDWYEQHFLALKERYLNVREAFTSGYNSARSGLDFFINAPTP